jgi:flagellar motility protein MotE (MotC chaperone)
MTDRRNLVAIAVFVVASFGGILAIHSYDQKLARAQEAVRVKAEQSRIAQEEAKRAEMEAAQEQKRLAQEKENEQRRMEQERENAQKRLAEEQEQMRLAEREQERILSQIPVILSSNDFVVLSFGQGTLFDCNAVGLLFRENRLDAHTPWAMLTEEDAKAVIRTPTGFEAVTRFGPKANTPTDFEGSDLEQQMRKIWHQGNTLKERLITRMEILGICEDYNKARARYFAASASSAAYDAAARKATNVANQTAAKNRAGSFYALTSAAQQDYASGRFGGSSSDLLRQMAASQVMSASGRLDYSKANQYSRMSGAQSAGATTAERELDEYITRLAELGLQLTDSGAYPTIPPMNLRREIAVELNSNPMPATPTNAPSVGTNTRPQERSQ